MNWPTLLIALLVAVVFVAIVASEIRKRKSGKGGCGCGCGCSDCAMSGTCHGGSKARHK